MFRLTRKKDNVSAEIDFKVFVDNTEVGLLKNDSFLEFNFPNGEHEMYVTCDEYRSEKVKFEIDDNQMMYYKCYPLYNDSKISHFFYKKVCGKIAIKLKMENDFHL